MIDVAWWDFAALEGLRADDRLRVLSREAAAVLFRLVLVARAGDEVPYLNHHTGAQSVAVYDLRESDTTATRDASAKGAKELVDTGLVILDDAARVIRLNLHRGVLSREAAPAGAPRVAESGRPRRPPSASPERARDRKLRFQFARRSGPFRKVSIPEGATWEAWSVSPEGAALLAKVTAERGTGTTRERVGNDPRNEAGTRGNDPGTTPPPHTPSPEETKSNNKTDTQSAREGNDPGTTPGNGTGTTPRNDPERSLLPSVDLLGLHVEDLVAALRDGAAGKVLVHGAGDSRVALPLQHALTELAAGPLRADRATLGVLAAWYAAGSQSWRAQTPGLREIAAKPGMLAEHVEAALAWHREGRKPFGAGAAPPARLGASARRMGPAPVSTAASRRDDNDPTKDPLAEMLR